MSQAQFAAIREAAAVAGTVAAASAAVISVPRAQSKHAGAKVLSVKQAIAAAAVVATAALSEKRVMGSCNGSQIGSR